jgi:hypothetical protein
VLAVGACAIARRRYRTSALAAETAARSGLIATKFTSGAWVVVLTVPALMLLFSRIKSYYRAVGLELNPAGRRPHPRDPAPPVALPDPAEPAGLPLATVLRASTDVVICTIPYRLTTR